MTDQTTYRLDLIDPNPWQPRLSMDPAGIEELALSIARDGLMQVPVARQAPPAYSVENADGTVGGGLFQLALGHRRLEAFRLLVAIQEMICAGQAEDSQLTTACSTALAAGRSFNEIPLDVQDLTDRQMFEMAVSENVQRADLNPIELAAAMQRYLDEFQVSSEQAGQFFGVSGSTVRGTVRLLDLPAAAQQALAEGKITVGIGRLLLTITKVANTKVIKSIMADLSEGNDLPDLVIQRHLENERGEIVQMWSKHQGGQPRAGHSGWLLDMKNFPNQMLDPLDADVAAKALGYDQKYSPVLDHLKGRILKLTGKYPGTLPTDPLADPVHEEKLQTLINPPACTACQFYAKVNSNHFCGIRECYGRKQAAYKAQKLADLSRTLKIDIYQKSDGAYIALDADHASHRKAFDNRNPDLRLIGVDEYKGSWCYQDLTGLNREIAKVVIVGKSAEKLAVKGSHTRGGKKSEAEKAEMRAMKVYRQRRKQLLWEYCCAAQVLFASLPKSVVDEIKGWHYVGVDDKFTNDHILPEDATKDEKLEYARCALVLAMIDDVTSHYNRKSFAKALDGMMKITTIPAPEELVGLAEKWDEEIEALATVSAETGAA